MFIGKYEIDGKEYFNIYDKKNGGYDSWYNDTWSSETKNIDILNFIIFGKTYKEKKDYLVELAKEWQLDFSQYSWSYYELYIIQSWFYKNAKRYGLLKEFRENAIC